MEEKFPITNQNIYTRLSNERNRKMLATYIFKYLLKIEFKIS